MRTVEMTDASADLSHLIDAVEKGGTIRFTRDGKAVARLLPLVDGNAVEVTPEKRKRAVQAMKDMDSLSRKLNLGPFNFEEFKEDRDAGRR